MSENLTPIATPPAGFNRDEFRVQLLLALPGITAGDDTLVVGLDEVAPEAAAYVSAGAGDYDGPALAAWVLEQLDDATRQAADAGEAVLSEVASMATANGILSLALEVETYIRQVAEVLKRNMGISEQWDLSRTMRAEADRLAGVAKAIGQAHPALVRQVSPGPLDEALVTVLAQRGQ